VQIFREDIHPCFDFANAQVCMATPIGIEFSNWKYICVFQFSQEVLQSVLDNTVIIEPVADKSPFPKCVEF
jgi:hypothetical protein